MKNPPVLGVTPTPGEAEDFVMKRERLQKRVERPRDRAVELPPLSARDVFFPYPIRRDPGTPRAK